MATEIERKFLIEPGEWDALLRNLSGWGIAGLSCRQGYLHGCDRYAVRVQIKGPKAYFGLKALVTMRSRLEFEYEIPVPDAEQLLSLCPGAVVEKTRYVVPFSGKQWDVDDFTGRNAGLVTAEVELESEDEAVSLPDWVGREISDDPRYLNVNLAASPYDEWGAVPGDGC